jgi:type I restriction enzyme, S subunit
VRELPEGWETCKLEDLSSDVSYGYTATSGMEFNGPKMLRITDIQNNQVNWSTVPHCEISEADKAKLLLEKGDLVFARSGATVGKSFLIKTEIPESVYASYLIRVRCTNRQFTGYLNLYFQSPEYWSQITDFSAGVGQPNVNGTKLKNLQIPLPPLNEQKRIADRLDQLLTRIDKTKAHLDRLPPLLKRFRQSVLAAATSGKLTQDWREERSLDIRNWKDIAIGQLIDRIEAGINVQCEERPPLAHEYGLVKISAVTWGIYDDSKSKTIPVTHTVPESTRITVGDFLISRANTLELVAACVIVEKVERPVFLSDKVLRVVMNEEHKKWLLFWLRSENGRQQIESLASGNQLSMRNITQASIKSITLQLPTIAEQQEIVRRVEALFAKADRIEAQYKNARQQVDRLTPALLAKAFRGELVPQDPNDEPASVLLERVKEGRSIGQTKTVQRAKKKIKS